MATEKVLSLLSATVQLLCRFFGVSNSPPFPVGKRRGLVPGKVSFNAENIQAQSNFESVKKNLVLEI